MHNWNEDVNDASGSGWEETQQSQGADDAETYIGIRHTVHDRAVKAARLEPDSNKQTDERLQPVLTDV